MLASAATAKVAAVLLVVTCDPKAPGFCMVAQYGHAALRHWRKEPYSPARDERIQTGQWHASTPPPEFAEGALRVDLLEELPELLMGRGGIGSDRRESPGDHRAGEGST